jgi:hypothetical protein
MAEFPEVTISVKQTILTKYIIIKGKLDLARKRSFKKMMARKDHNYIVMLEPKEEVDSAAQISRDLFAKSNPYHLAGQNLFSSMHEMT